MDFDYSAYYNALVFDFKKHYGQMFDPSQTSHQRPFNKEAVSDFFFEGNGAKNGTTCNAADVTQLRHHLPKDSERQLRDQSLDYQFLLWRAIVRWKTQAKTMTTPTTMPPSKTLCKDKDRTLTHELSNVRLPGCRLDFVKPQFVPSHHFCCRVRAHKRHIVYSQSHTPMSNTLFSTSDHFLCLGPPMPYNALHAPQHPIRFPIVNVPPLALPPQGPPMPYNALYAPQHPIRFPIVNVPPLVLPPPVSRGNQCCVMLCLFNITIIQSTAYRFRGPTRGKQCCIMLCLFNITIIQSTAYRFRCHIRGKQCCVMLCLFNITIIQSTAYRFRCHIRGKQCCVMLCLFNITIIQSTAYHSRGPIRGKQCCVMLCLFNITIIQSTAYHSRGPIRGKQCCVMLCLFNITINQSTAYHSRGPIRGKQCCVMLCLFNIIIIQSTAYHFRGPIRGKQCCVMLCLFNIIIIQSTAYLFRCPIRLILCRPNHGIFHLSSLASRPSHKEMPH
ncbi:hypothetical protein niasHT_005568 [Heterodera trifolii]|uniref:Uncharacterized protein n=1 Tax=Heterodera trifolii TaxID=157864 RepID=A0ABD2LQJ0_9BILA